MKIKNANNATSDSSDKLVHLSDFNIAVILPCYNEEVAIAQTISEFKAAIPQATVYVFDNASSDNTAEVATRAGAVVHKVDYRGKGNVVRRMFSNVDADVYIMADGDATYDATMAAEMVEHLIVNNLDMVNGARKHTESEAYRPGHQFGNWMLTALVQIFFGKQFKDLLSGYRVFSRRFVKSFPAKSRGFEIETELTVHALQLRMPTDEIQTVYRARPVDSISKLSTYSDGLRILKMIGFLVKEEKPLAFFTSLSVVILIPSMFLFVSVLFEYFDTGAVARFPSLFVSLSGFVISVLSLVCALILDTISNGRREARHLLYLQYNAPQKPMLG